ncbi:MAG: hypothetical protein V7711_02060 [Pseudomonadales bacterium]
MTIALGTDTYQPIEKQYRITQSRNGALNSSQFGERMTASGPFAEIIGKRFEKACKVNGVNKNEHWQLDCSRFRNAENRQQSLF